ncbi:FAD-dependent oxidoreductase [Alcanivorax sp. JB21]|uniref:flavin monoamine oxidase family protein n=1 Tax=Alcanivorax limicola TaxID=2874102 RepID=UPI001CC03992|nr:FAD-dependent oxidoreductase [Alcanivorax limicola]MBZ2189973.1 FAD-dependent oxidoreductase [Alcanivorax limicola]
MDAEIIVLGAGFAGLSAADALTRAGRNVLLLEARDRVGGRTLTEHYGNDLWLDLGGQWLGPGQTHMYALAARFGKTVWPMYVAGRNVLYVNERRRTYRGPIPWRVSPWALANIGWGFLRLEQLARRIPLESPWEAANAAALDAQSVGDWMRRNLRSRVAFDVLRVAVESVFAAHPDDISLLHALFYVHSGGGLMSLTSSRNGAQQDRVSGGLQGLAGALAAGLQEQDVPVLLEQPVLCVEQSGSRVKVHTPGGVYEAGRVISTLPPVLTAQVDFRPGQPTARAQWCEQLTPGRVIKCFAVYDRPFWREERLSGSAISDAPPLHVAFDATPPGTEQGILMGFIEGRAAEQWALASVEERQQVVTAAFARFFGMRARQPRRYLDHVWANETWSRGCYAGVAPPGLLSRLGASVRTPHGRVHWAGTETASHWNGYIEGAVRSGLRAAEEVLQASI